jgi:hypothetical protein
MKTVQDDAREVQSDYFLAPVRPNPASSQAEVVAVSECLRMDQRRIRDSRASNPAVKLQPLIGVPATNTPKDRKTGHGIPLHVRAADGARRRAQFSGRAIQAPDFIGCPAAKKSPLRIVAAPEFLGLAADRARRVQLVIAALECVQFELERPVVVRASDPGIPPELLDDMMRLYC